MDMQAAIKAVTEQQNLNADEMTSVMRTIMTGDATPAQVGGFLVGLRMKGETVDEIASAAAVMRELAISVNVQLPNLVDTCGTGGDGSGTFNISTASAIVVAAAGGYVAKHGNRSVSGKTGSADVLEAAGVRLDLNADQVANCIERAGVGFMFAPQHHSAMKHAIGPRREMAVRTVFNLLGPLTNPANARNQVIGVFDEKWVEPLAQVLKRLGSSHVLIVHGSDGMDEITISGSTSVAELKDGEVNCYQVQPADFGMETADLSTLKAVDVQASLDTVKAVFAGETGPASDVVALNAGAAIYAADKSATLAEGVKLAQAALADGSAQKALERLVAVSQELGGQR